MTDKLRVATVGTGYFSRFHYNAWHSMKNVELVALCNRTKAPGEELAGRYGILAIYDDLDRLLAENDVDILDIISPPVTHMEYVRKAMAHDVTLICQKPFTPTLAEARTLVGEIEAADRQVVIHDNFRFQPWYSLIKALLEGGDLGDLYQVTFRLRPGDGQGPEAYLERQPYFQQMERFLVHETAIYLIDVFRFLSGDITSVCARLDKLNLVIAGEDTGIILFEFANGGRGLFDDNRLSDHAAEKHRLTMGEMLIEGSAARLRVDGDGWIYLRPHGENIEQEITYSSNDREFGGDYVRCLQQHVVDHIVHDALLMNAAADYLANLEIEEAVSTSADSGRVIDMVGGN